MFSNSVKTTTEHRSQQQHHHGNSNYISSVSGRSHVTTNTTIFRSNVYEDEDEGIADHHQHASSFISGVGDVIFGMPLILSVDDLHRSTRRAGVDASFVSAKQADNSAAPRRLRNRHPNYVLDRNSSNAINAAVTEAEVDEDDEESISVYYDYPASEHGDAGGEGRHSGSDNPDTKDKKEADERTKFKLASSMSRGLRDGDGVELPMYKSSSSTSTPLFHNREKGGTIRGRGEDIDSLIIGVEEDDWYSDTETDGDDDEGNAADEDDSDDSNLSLSEDDEDIKNEKRNRRLEQQMLFVAMQSCVANATVNNNNKNKANNFKSHKGGNSVVAATTGGEGGRMVIHGVRGEEKGNVSKLGTSSSRQKGGIGSMISRKARESEAGEEHQRDQQNQQDEGAADSGGGLVYIVGQSLAARSRVAHAQHTTTSMYAADAHSNRSSDPPSGDEHNQSRRQQGKQRKQHRDNRKKRRSRHRQRDAHHDEEDDEQEEPLNHAIGRDDNNNNVSRKKKRRKQKHRKLSDAVAEFFRKIARRFTASFFNTHRKVSARTSAFLKYLHFKDETKERRFVVFNNQNDIEGTVAMLLSIGGSVFYYLNSFFEPQHKTFLVVMPLEGAIIVARICFIVYGRVRQRQLSKRIREASRDVVLEATPHTMAEVLTVATAAASTSPSATVASPGTHKKGALQQGESEEEKRGGTSNDGTGNKKDASLFDRIVEVCFGSGGSGAHHQQGNTTNDNSSNSNHGHKRKPPVKATRKSLAQLKEAADDAAYFVAKWNEYLVYIFIALNNIVCFVSYPNIKYCGRANDPIPRRDCTDSFWIWPGAYSAMLLYLFVSLPRLMPFTWVLVVSHTILYILGRWLDPEDTGVSGNKVYAAQGLLGCCICAVALTFLTKSEEMRREMFVSMVRVDRFQTLTVSLQDRIVRHMASSFPKELAKQLVGHAASSSFDSLSSVTEDHVNSNGKREEGAKGNEVGGGEGALNCSPLESTTATASLTRRCTFVLRHSTIVTVRLANFTEWSSRNDRRQTSIHLRQLFALFDRAALKVGVYHVATFGDMYAVAANMERAKVIANTNKKGSVRKNDLGGLEGAGIKDLSAINNVLEEEEEGKDNEDEDEDEEEEAISAAERGCVFAAAILANRNGALRIKVATGPIVGVASYMLEPVGYVGLYGKAASDIYALTPSEMAEVVLCDNTRKLLEVESLDEFVQKIRARSSGGDREEEEEISCCLVPKGCSGENEKKKIKSHHDGCGGGGHPLFSDSSRCITRPTAHANDDDDGSNNNTNACDETNSSKEKRYGQAITIRVTSTSSHAAATAGVSGTPPPPPPPHLVVDGTFEASEKGGGASESAANNNNKTALSSGTESRYGETTNTAGGCTTAATWIHSSSNSHSNATYHQHKINAMSNYHDYSSSSGEEELKAGKKLRCDNNNSNHFNHLITSSSFSAFPPPPLPPPSASFFAKRSGCPPNEDENLDTTATSVGRAPLASSQLMIQHVKTVATPDSTISSSTPTVHTAGGRKEGTMQSGHSENLNDRSMSSALGGGSGDKNRSKRKSWDPRREKRRSLHNTRHGNSGESKRLEDATDPQNAAADDDHTTMRNGAIATGVGAAQHDQEDDHAVAIAAQRLFANLSGGERSFSYSDLQRRLAEVRASHFKMRWQFSFRFKDAEIEDCFVRDVGVRVASSSAVVAGSVFFWGLSLGCLILLFLDIRPYEFRPATTFSAAMFSVSTFASAFMLYCIRRLKVDNALMMYFALIVVWQTGLASSPPGMLTNGLQVWSIVLYLISYMLLPPGVMTTAHWLMANGLLVAAPMSLMTVLLDTFAVASTIFYHFAALLFLAYMHQSQEFSTRGRFLDTIFSYFLAKSLQSEIAGLYHQLRMPEEALSLIGEGATSVAIPRLRRDEVDPLNMYGKGGRLRILDLELKNPPPPDIGIDETAMFVMNVLDTRTAASLIRPSSASSSSSSSEERYGDKIDSYLAGLLSSGGDGNVGSPSPSAPHHAFLMRLASALCDDAMAKFGCGSVFKAQQHGGLIILATRDSIPAIGHLARVVQNIFTRIYELRDELVVTCTLTVGMTAAVIVGDEFLTFQMYGDTLQTALRVVQAAPPTSLTCSERFRFVYECWKDERLLLCEHHFEIEFRRRLQKLMQRDAEKKNRDTIHVKAASAAATGGDVAGGDGSERHSDEVNAQYDRPSHQPAAPQLLLPATDKERQVDESNRHDSGNAVLLGGDSPSPALQMASRSSRVVAGVPEGEKGYAASSTFILRRRMGQHRHQQAALESQSQSLSAIRQKYAKRSALGLGQGNQGGLLLAAATGKEQYTLSISAAVLLRQETIRHHAHALPIPKKMNANPRESTVVSGGEVLITRRSEEEEKREEVSQVATNSNKATVMSYPYRRDRQAAVRQHALALLGGGEGGGGRKSSVSTPQRFVENEEEKAGVSVGEIEGDENKMKKHVGGRDAEEVAVPAAATVVADSASDDKRTKKAPRDADELEKQAYEEALQMAFAEEVESFPFEMHEPTKWKLRGRGIVAIHYVSVVADSDSFTARD